MRGLSALAGSLVLTNVGWVSGCAQIDEIRQWLPDDRLAYIESINHRARRRGAITFKFRSAGSIFNFGQIVSADQSGARCPLYGQVRFGSKQLDRPACWLSQTRPHKPLIAVGAEDIHPQATHCLEPLSKESSDHGDPFCYAEPLEMAEFKEKY